MVQVTRNMELIEFRTDQSTSEEIFNGGLKRLLINEDLSSVKTMHIYLEIDPANNYTLQSNFEAYTKSLFGKSIHVCLFILPINNYVPILSKYTVLNLKITGIDTVIISCKMDIIYINQDSIIKQFIVTNKYTAQLCVYGVVKHLQLESNTLLQQLEVNETGVIGKISNRNDAEEKVVIDRIIIKNHSNQGYIGTITKAEVRRIDLPVMIMVENDLAWFIPENCYWNIQYGHTYVKVNEIPMFIYKLKGKKREKWMYCDDI